MRAFTLPSRPMLALAALIACLGIGPLQASPLATMRIDYHHGGDAKAEHYALARVLVEPLPWSGNPARSVDTSNRGQNKFEIVDVATGTLLYSRGYGTIFSEWRTTEEAAKLSRGFEESLRFPAPTAPFEVRVYKRDGANAFVPAWSFTVDPNGIEVERKAMPAPAKPIAIRDNGPPANKVDLLILGDGYTAAQAGKFEADARRLSDRLFATSPFKERAADFNVWGLMVPTPEAGVSRPSTGTFHATALGTRYDIFGSERYVLTLDNRALRDLAQHAPNEFIEILVNNETYGGGGIFGQFSTAAVDSGWSDYLFVHEFGHHFAGLADEYYTSPVAYAPATSRVEPWEPNVTAARDRASLKWRDRVDAKTAIPTPWRKAKFETQSRAIQKRRAALRASNQPESKMNALFREELAAEKRLFARDPNLHRVGLFEGANYEATGYFRPQMQCLMFDRSDAFCQVCRDAIGEIIDLYSRP